MTEQPPEEMFRELVTLAKTSIESQNSLQQEHLAEYQKALQNPPEKLYQFEGYFTPTQLEKLGEFLKGAYFNGRK